jgi:hypothetical protein
MIWRLSSQQVWPVSRGCLLLHGTWSYLCICQGSVLSYTRFCNCLFYYDYTWHIVNITIFYFTIIYITKPIKKYCWAQYNTLFVIVSLNSYHCVQFQKLYTNVQFSFHLWFDYFKLPKLKKKGGGGTSSVSWLGLFKVSFLYFRPCYYSTVNENWYNEIFLAKN